MEQIKIRQMENNIIIYEILAVTVVVLISAIYSVQENHLKLIIGCSVLWLVLFSFNNHIYNMMWK